MSSHRSDSAPGSLARRGALRARATTQSGELGLANDGRFNEMNVSRKNPLHLSTLLIVAGTAFALLLIVIPGEIILLAVGFLVERRRRKRNSFWQVSLPELLGIFVAVAVIVTLVTESFQQIQREAKARQLLVEPQACSFEFVDAAPAWLRKLTDNSRFLPGSRIRN